MRFNAALGLPLHLFTLTCTFPPYACPLLLLSSRILHARYTDVYRAALSLFLSPLRSAFVATVKLALRGTHLSLIPEANPSTMDHESASTSRGSIGGDDFRRCRRSSNVLVRHFHEIPQIKCVQVVFNVVFCFLL